MAKYKFNLENNNVLDNIRSPLIYQFNMAQNLALLSNDASVIRNFYNIDAEKLLKDIWFNLRLKDKFLAQVIDGQAFAFFGICSMIVNGMINLIASSGFKFDSNNKPVDERLGQISEEADIETLFADGVYWESGIGDFLYRLSCNLRISNKPIVEIIEPPYFEIHYKNGKIRSYEIKIPADDDKDYELREIYYQDNEGMTHIIYRFYYDKKYVNPTDKALVKQCMMHFPGVNLKEKVLPFLPLVYKKNSNTSKLYKGERGVPDIQGLDSIEDALSETLSDLIDAIRKGGTKVFMSEQMVPQDEKGNSISVNHFDKTIILTKGSPNPSTPEELYKVVQGDIKWEAYVKTIQNLMSVAINKAGLSPTTLGLTGLESINSSQESQDAREKPSLRTRSRKLKGWEKTLKELLNKYLQVCDYIEDRPILDYRGLIKIHFNEYVSPSVENITEVLANQVMAGLKSHKTAIKDLNPEYSDQDVDQELIDIMSEQGQPVLQAGGPSSGTNMENSTPKNPNLENSNS